MQIPEIDGWMLIPASAILAIVIASVSISILIKKIGKMRKKTKVERAPILQSSRKVVTEAKIPGKGTVTQKCPHCGGDLSELNFYKLKAGNDVKCDYCEAIISGGK